MQDQNMKTMSWGIIGCGDVTEVKSGPAFQNIDSSRLVAVMRRDGQKAEDYARRHGVPGWYTDADDLIHDKEVNAVYIATPPSSHAEYTIRALRAGKPVYCEKPMALNYGQCLEMLRVSAETGQPLFVAYYRRKLPQFMLVKELLAKNTIGEIRFVSLQLFQPPRENDFDPDKRHWHVIPETGGGGYFADMSPHQWDILDYWFGPVKYVRSLVRNLAGKYPAEDYVSALFEFESGIPGAGQWCFTVNQAGQKDTIEITGTEGTIRLSCFGYMPVTVITSNGIKEHPYTLPEHIQQPFIESVVNELTGKGLSASDALAASRTNRIVDEVLKDYYD